MLDNKTTTQTQTERETQTNRQTKRRTDRQRERERERKTETERGIKKGRERGRIKREKPDLAHEGHRCGTRAREASSRAWGVYSGEQSERRTASGQGRLVTYVADAGQVWAACVCVCVYLCGHVSKFAF